MNRHDSDINKRDADNNKLDSDLITRRKLKKTKYFFRPENRLTGPNLAGIHSSLSNTVHLVHLKPHLMAQNEVHKVEAVKHETDKQELPKSKDYDQFVVQNQSSDESFEGIKWRSPTNNKIKIPSSSPLKNMVNDDDVFGVSNDRAELMLMKYGSGLVNIADRSKSTSNLSPSLDQKPSLPRAKSLGEKEPSKLNSWLSRFSSVEGGKSNDTSKFSGSTSGTAETTRAAVRDSVEKGDKPDVDMSDFSDFSDDDDFLATLAIKSNTTSVKGSLVELEQEVKQQRKQEVEQEGKQVKQEGKQDGKQEIKFESDFSDDLDFPDLDNEYAKDIAVLTKLHDDFRPPTAFLSYSRGDLKRFKIQHILPNTFKTNDRVGKQIILSVRDGQLKDSKLIVRGEYTNLPFEVGDIINFILTHPEAPTLVDDLRNILIWHPDVLVSATTVSQQLSCSRKPVLTDRFNFPGESSVPLLVGIILHEIFQACFVKEDWSLSLMETLMKELIEENIMTIFSLDKSRQDIETEIYASLPYLKLWFDTYYKKTSSISSALSEGLLFSASRALDIEENIWSPLFGIKGKVDVTLEAKIQSSFNKGTSLIPMEIKTGRPYMSHNAQSSLYSLLFKDRYNTDVNSFLLVYTKEKMSRLEEIRSADLRSLVNLRNRVAQYLCEGVRQLPSVMKGSVCDRCDVQTECMTIHHLLEDGTSESSGLPENRFSELTLHLNKPLYKDFYNYWDILITKEELLLTKLKKDLWLMTAKQREQINGRALANLVITEHSENSDSFFKYNYTLVRSGPSDLPKDSFQKSNLSKFDRVIISDEEGHFTIAGAMITSIRANKILVAANRRIINPSNKLSSFGNGGQSWQSALHEHGLLSQDSSKTYRIDKDEMFHGMGLARYNILNLFLINGDSRRRQQIVDLVPPRYLNVQASFGANNTYNVDQKRAFDKVLSTQDYSLILGMPGTGKTTLIAGLIDYLAKQGKSVLLTSYTHSAVDNILLKLKEYDISILRIGHPSRVHKDIRQFCPQDISNKEDYLKAYLEPMVVAVSCLGINDPFFNLRSHFDYCIIDEASQVSLPVSLGPLRFCDKFILVGDHNQLPPLVQHTDTLVKAGLSNSLFQFLTDNFPQSVTELTYQYRMCSDIMKLLNELVYDNMLKCGSEAVANQTLKIPNPLGYKSMVTGEKDFWMKWVLKEDNKVVFLDHDLVPAYERSIGEKMENFTEAQLIAQIVDALILCGVDEKSIGIMSLYRAQLRLLNKFMMGRENIETMTADQFQGRDKDCVVISLTRSNKEKRVGDLLQEWRRINVAITRAKCKLIILGSRSTLSLGGGVMKQFLDLVHQEKWIYRLPPGANSHYLQTNPDSQKSRGGPNTPVKISKVTSQSRVVQNSPLIRDIVNEI